MTATTPTAKFNKLNNRKSKRDIEREIRISNKGGESIEILYGCPLDDETRLSRISLENQLNRIIHDSKIKQRVVKPRRTTRLTGAARSQEQFIKNALRMAKIRADKLGLRFDITVKDLNIPDVCPIFSTPLTWTNKISNDTPSIDRLIPSEGYVKGNVAFISMRANRIKSDASIEDLEKIVNWMKSQR